MKQNQKHFLSQFDQPMRKHIINFCNILSKTNYEVYILLARKAACFIDTLIELDLIELNGTIVSDRILECNRDWLKNKSVAIIDDTIISGTSIYKLIQKLEEIKIETIDVYTFCINEYWYVDEMLKNSHGISYLKEPYIKLDHNSSLKFCKNIVEALALTPRPYNIDFPIYEKIKLTTPKLNKLFDSLFWKIVETTSTKQREHNIYCFTLNPSKKFIEQYELDLGWKIAEIAHFKLRLYANKNVENTGKTTYISKLVPYIIFNPISEENTKEIINSIIKHENLIEDNLLKQLNTSSSNLLFIQYYYAEKLFQTWLKCLDQEIDISNNYHRNKRILYFLFTPEIIDTILTIKFEEIKPFSNVNKLFLSDKITFNNEKSEINPIEYLSNLIQPFLDLYYKKELPARRIVRKLNKKAFLDFSYIDIINRLDDGISLNELKTILSNTINNISDANQIVSLFLDKYIDNGVIVPITVNKNGYVYRGFRHGEEIIWGNYNNRLLGKYYKKYLNYISSDTLSETYFQKLLVLFLKIGLKEGVLEEYSTLTPRNIKTKLLSIKAHLFGLVSDYIELEPNETKIHLPIIDPNVKSYWTSKFLQDYEIITIKNNKVYFNFEKFDKPYTSDIEENEPTDFDSSDLDKIYDIADTFGYLRNSKQINEKELVLLTSCINLHDNTASLAAELQIYLNGIGSYKNKLLNGKKSDYLLESLKTLRDKNINYCWTAVNSGYFKFWSYSRNEGLEYLIKIEKFFEENGKQSEARIWRRYWKTDIELSKNEVNELKLTNLRMGHLLLEANLTLTIIHIIIYELLLCQNKVDNYLQNSNKEINEIKEQISTINGRLQKIKIEEKQDLFIDNLVRDAILNEKEVLQKKIDSKNHDIEYWINYPKVNLDFIEELKIVYLSQNIYTNNSKNLAKMSNMFYKQLSNPELEQLLDDNISYLEEMTEDVRSIMNDYKLTVPEWGKIQQKVKYNHFIHLNSNLTNTKDRENISKIIRHYLVEFELEEFGNESENKTINLLRISNAETGLGQIIGIRGQFVQERLIKLSCKLLIAFREKNIPISISAYPNLKDNGIYAYFNNHTKCFDIVKDNLFEDLERNLQSDNVIIYDKNDKHNLLEFIQYKVKHFKDTILINEGNSKISHYPNYTIEVNMKTESINGTIGVITALPKEFAAMKCVLDSEISSLQKPPNDNNDYAIGYINSLNGNQIMVVVALMKETGTNNAASTATNLLRSFPDIDDIIVCGIAGGVPHHNKPEEHVRLGDIVVCDKNGVLQYDNIKETIDEIKIRDASSKPSAKLLGIVNLLKAEYELNNIPWKKYITKYSKKLRNSGRPDVSKDILNIMDITVIHPMDSERIENDPRVFHGPIASSNTLLKNERKRDFLRDSYGVKAIEMEGSGIADGTWTLSKGYIIVRGIVDYCNSDKNDDWHNYAAISAASYSRSIIERM